MTSAYIAGPMRGIDQFNFPMFDEAAFSLRLMGWQVFSPAEHDRESGFDERLNDLTGFDLKAAFQWDCNRICEVDYIVLLPGWEASTGVKAELAVAEMVGTEVRYYHPGPCWSVSRVAPGKPSRTVAGDVWAVASDEPVFEHGYTAAEVDELLPLIPDWGPGSKSGQEVRVVNATTGGAKGIKIHRYDLIPAAPLREVARLYGEGAKKYAERNWELGYDWSLSFGALNRHLWQFWSGEEFDSETKCSHLASVVFHALALMEFEDTHPELDNRPRVDSDME